MSEPDDHPYLTEVASQVKAWDAARPRSQQKDMGWSDVSGCRAQMGFELAEEWPTDHPDLWRPIAGTWLHEQLTQVRYQACLKDDLAGYPGCPVQFGFRVEYRGVRGTADEVRAGAGEFNITDYKFPRLASAALWESSPEVLAEAMIQVHGYGAGVIQTEWWRRAVEQADFSGRPKVRLLAMPVDGRFSDWRLYEEELDISIADAAIDRLAYVQEAVAAGDSLPRDKPIYFCQIACQFFGLCRGYDPPPKELELITDTETATAIDQYGLAGEQESAARALRKLLRPLVEGHRGRTELGFKVWLGREQDGKLGLDERAVEEDYASRGQIAPMVRKAPPQRALTVVRDKRKDGTDGRTDEDA